MSEIDLREKDTELEGALAILEGLGVETGEIMEELGIEPKISPEKNADDKEIV